MTNIDYIICIPVYKVNERTRKCINSIKDYEHVLLIDNTEDRECSVFLKSQRYKGLRVKYQNQNAGVPRAWNVGLREKHDWTFIVSSSMIFQKGFKPIAAMLEGYEGLIFRTNHSWHCAGLSKEIIEQVGYFDENFFPGYLEDCDWDYRSILNGTKEYGNYDIPAICQVSGGATIDGAQVIIAPLRDYFVSKWGGPEWEVDDGPYVGYPTVWQGGKTIYKHPFNNKENDIKYWEPAEIQDLKDKYGLL